MRTRTSAAMLIFRAGSGVTLAGRAEELKAARGGGGENGGAKHALHFFIVDVVDVEYLSVHEKNDVREGGISSLDFWQLRKFF